MNNQAILLKVKERINKLDSQDYDNLESWQIIEAFNKAQSDWCRRQLHGYNNLKEGDEQSKKRIDDLQILLTDAKMTSSKQDRYYRTGELPENYFAWKRIAINGSNECCKERRAFVVYLAEEANVEELLRDKNRRPSFSWAETFCTLKSNRVNIYTNNEFEITDVLLTYYKQPAKIEIAGISNPYTQAVSNRDVLCEFKDDVTEVLIDECVSIISKDLANYYNQQYTEQNVEKNN